MLYSVDGQTEEGDRQELYRLENWQGRCCVSRVCRPGRIKVPNSPRSWKVWGRKVLYDSYKDASGEHLQQCALFIVEDLWKSLISSRVVCLPVDSATGWIHSNAVDKVTKAALTRE
jgi:hypothetical protein